MPTIDMICLANSRKMQGRCLAGLRTDGQGWIRPISSSPDGTLYPSDYTLQDSTEPQQLDVVRIECSKQHVEPHQPENWLLTRAKWQLISRPAPPDLFPMLYAAAVPGPDLLGNMQAKQNYDDFLSVPAQASLALVFPQNIQWNITTSYRGSRQTKARFSISGAYYELSVTDPIWVQGLRHIPLGLHPLSVAGLAADEEILFTVSLSEPTPWDNCCYKLIAAVIVLRRQQR